MTNEDLEDKYPRWRDALFGNHNAVANLKCPVPMSQAPKWFNNLFPEEEYDG